MIVATTLVALNQANIINISLLTKKINEVESKNRELQDEITNLKTDTKKRKKVDDRLIPLTVSIMIEQELLHDAKVECFAKVQKMEDIINSLDKHIENASQVNINTESLRENIEELD